MNDINNLLINDLKNNYKGLIIILKSNPKSRVYKNEVYWFNTNEDYVSEFDFSEQEFNSVFCKDIKEAYAYGFDVVRSANKKYPNISMKIIDIAN